ncbi:beta-galactosidase [halophilic archaeon]|nr:beta-galactosidase [halophilic archaeon]
MSSNTTPRSEFRTTETLSGSWEFTVDPSDRGLAEQWFEPESEWSDKRTVEIPHAWQELDELREYTGTAWYRRTFEIDETPQVEENALVRFGAVDYAATVWVNGTRVGANQGGYLPFQVDVTDVLNEGVNTVVVRVHDPEDLREIPHGKQGPPWYTRVSGIWQSVSLRFRPAMRVETASITPDLASNTVTVDVDVHSETRTSEDIDARVTVRLDGTVVAGANTTDLASPVELSVDDPDYWTPDSPTLYDIVVRLEQDGTVVDKYVDTFGFRSVGIADGNVTLNGEPITIRGVLDQGYYPETLYRPRDEDVLEWEIKRTKELGFNLVRKHLKPAHPDFLDLADKHGLLVWEEPASPSVDTEKSRAAVREQLRKLVERDYNHPSVVVWSLYNEEWGFGNRNKWLQQNDETESLWSDDEKQAYLTDFYDTVSEWDPTRLICDNSGWAHVATDINDYHRYFVEPDRSQEWTDDLDHILTHPGDNYGVVDTTVEDVPIIVSEFGTWGMDDVGAIRDQYDGDPPWFHHDFLTDEYKQPNDVDANFASTALETVFDDYADLAATWQEREFTSLKSLIQEMRSREDVAGYVLTQLTDVEWEFNGVLTYLRERKAFYDRLAAINGDVMVALEPARRVAWADETVPVDVVVVNDSTKSVTGTLSWTVDDDEEAEVVALDPRDQRTIEGAFSVSAREDTEVTTVEMTASLADAPNDPSTEESVTFVDRETATFANETVIYLRGTAVSALVADGVDVRHQLDDDVDVAITTRIDQRLEAFAEAGGHVLVVPTSSGSMAQTDCFEFTDLPPHESWRLVSSLYYHDTPLLDDLTEGRRLGWTFEGVYPYAVVSDLDATDEVHVGYVEGWLANHSSPLVSRSYGDGSITACTFPLLDQYGEHPLTTTLMRRLLHTLSR